MVVGDATGRARPIRPYGIGHAAQKYVNWWRTVRWPALWPNSSNWSGHQSRLQAGSSIPIQTMRAVTILEQARASQRDIKSSGTVSLMSACAHLGRTNDAQRTMEEIRPIWIDRFLEYPNLPTVMTLYPFHKQNDAQWYASGLLKAGVCCEQDIVNIFRSKQE